MWNVECRKWNVSWKSLICLTRRTSQTFAHTLSLLRCRGNRLNRENRLNRTGAEQQATLALPTFHKFMHAVLPLIRSSKFDVRRSTFAISLFSLPTFHILLFTIVLCLAQQASAELFSGRVYTQPRKIYVNQPFELFLEMEITRGQKIDNIRIQGLPNNSEFITLGQMVQDKVRKNRHRKDGKVVDVLQFYADARCHRSLSQQFNPILSCDVVDRRSRGFFSFSSSSNKRIRLSPFNLTVKDLPVKNRPANFSGAVGEFRLNGTLSKNAVRPGDIITLSMELKGKGWLNSASVPAPENPGDFKCYPPKEILREKNRIRTEQIYIPNSTNAVAIPPAVFNYFNPKSERYEICSSPAFKINFITTAAVAQTNLVNVISTEESPLPSAATVTITARKVNTAFHKLLPVAAACLTLLAASFIFLTVVKLNKWIAIISTLLTVILGSFLSFKAARYEPAKEVALKGQTEIYLAPSRKAPLIMRLQNSTKVIPLENTEHWTRIEAEGRRGWVVNSALAH